MGKKLIIRGADFSTNGLADNPLWYNVVSSTTVTRSQAGGSIVNIGVGGYLPDCNALNKPINLIRVYLTYGISTSITFSVFKMSTDDLYTKTFESIKNFTVTSTELSRGYKDILLDEPITISASKETLAVGILNNSGNNNLPASYIIASSNHTSIVMRSTNPAKNSSVAEYLIQYGII